MTALDPQLLRKASLQLGREQFFPFVWRVFATLHPGREAEFVPAWHVKAMCHELDKVRSGENKRLVINVPPRHLKSITVAVAFVAYILGHHPDAKIIVASYGLDLARKHSQDCQKIMMSRWYREMFPATRLSKRGNTSDEIRTTRGGGRKAVSIGGAVTGHGADYIIIDDLLKAGDAESETELDRAQDFIEGSLLSRFDAPAEGRVVMIAQRLHERDPACYLLDKGTFRHLNLPAIAEDVERVAVAPGRFHCRKAGEALFPERMDLATLERQRREMGSVIFNCQYQQNPVAPDGSQLRWEWFGTYDEIGDRNSYQMVVQSWDTGTSAEPRSDYSVCTTWGLRQGQWHLLDVYRAKLDYPDLRRKTLALADRWEADKVLIEDASSGRQLFQECFDMDRRRFRAIKPERDKEVRFNAVCALIEEGKVLLPREAPWLPAFKRELQGFPRGRHDDQADSFSQFLNWSKGAGFWRSLGWEDPLRVERRKRREQRPRR